MDSQFYLTLPSNSVASNSAANFTTSLPIQIRLEGEWEVGLAEIIYGNTWYNVYQKNNQILLKVRENNSTILINIPKGRYEKVTGLIETISNEIDNLQKTSKIDLQSCFKISYNHHINSCKITINADVIMKIKVPPDIAYMLGFAQSQFFDFESKSGKETLTSQHPVDMSCGLNHLYIYCNILAPQIVGNVMAPLLQIVGVEGNYVDIVSRNYITPHYIPILKKTFSSIEINIRDDQNKPINFQYSKSIVKLHFRKIS
jgi:hypothetical protein